jgi:hypothetical protein
MALEQAGVQLIAQGAAAYAADMKGATSATDTFVDTTEKGGGIVSKAGGVMGSAIKTVAGIAAGVGVAGFVALGKAIFDGVGDAREAAKLNASTAQTIETMGNAAGRSVNQITDMASALSDASGKSLFGDDQIQQSANLLLTFGNIKEETFDLATALTVDLAQALGGEPADQAMMLGKALQDPIKGLTSLGKAGLTFSAEQKEMITSMVEAGDVAGAQALIIAELNKQVGGQAAAAAEADGGWQQFTATIGELQESVGAMLLPLLNDLVGVLNNSIVPVVENVVDAFGGVLEAFHEAGAGSSEFGESLDYLAQQLGIPEGIIQDVVFAVQDLVSWFNKGGAESGELGDAVEDLNGIWNKALSVIQNVMDGYMAVAQAVLPVIQRFIEEHGEEIEAFFKATWDSIIEIINLALDLYNAIVPPILQAIAGFINDHGEEIQKIFSGVWTMITSIITGALETIKAVLKTALALINGDWEGAWEGIKKIGEVQWTAIQGALKGFLDAIAGIFNTTFDDIVQTWEDNWNMLVDIATKIDWAEVGQSVVDGILNGLSSAWSSLTSWVSDKVAGLVDTALAAISAGSPAKDFMPVGQFATEGIMQGFEQTWPKLIEQVSFLSAKLIDEMSDVGKHMQNAIADGFGATASIDRQIAKNLDQVAKIEDDFQRKIVSQDLETLRKKATDLFGADPKAAADYYKMVSGHEFETLKLRQQIAEATTDAEKDRLNQQLILISRAQDAELDQFYAKQKGAVSPMQQIANEFNDILKSISELKNLTPDQLKVVDMLAGVYGNLASPPKTSPNPAYTGQTSYSSTTNVNMPVYSNNTPAALQQSWAVLQAGMI